MDADAAMQAMERDSSLDPVAQRTQPITQHQQAPTPAIADFDEAAPVALMEVAATTSAKAQTQSQAQTGAQMRTSHGWVNGPPRRERVTGRRGALSRERSQLRLQAAQDAQYAENLRRFAARREHFRVPASIPAVLERQRAAATLGETAEESAVESLIQLTEQKPVTLHHTNDIHAKLTKDQLFGRGLAVEANRRKTAWALANSPRNRPQAPAFQPLPPSPSKLAATQQPKAISFVQTKESRPFVLGPATAALPAKDKPARAAAPKPAAAAVVPEHEFVAGLPQAFMELDAATQVQILALADQELQAETKHAAQSKAQQTHTLRTNSKSKGASKHTALLQTKSAVARSAAPKSDELNEAELASAGEALHTLSEIHAATHTPWAKLLKALAGKK